jgi:hypothetical protein
MVPILVEAALFPRVGQPARAARAAQSGDVGDRAWDFSPRPSCLYVLLVALAEQAGTIVGTEARLLRQNVEGELLAQMRPNVVRHLCHLVARLPRCRRP